MLFYQSYEVSRGLMGRRQWQNFLSKFDAASVPRQNLEKAESYLQTFDLEQTAAVSRAAAELQEWVSTVLSTYSHDVLESEGSAVGRHCYSYKTRLTVLLNVCYTCRL